VAGIFAGNAVRLNPFVPFNNVVVIKRTASHGRNGELNYRGILIQDDVEIGLNGGYVIKAGNPYFTGQGGAAAMIAKLNVGVPNGTLSMPDKITPLAHPSRSITEHRLSGVATLQEHSRRVTTSALEARAGKRRIAELHRQAHTLLGNGTVADLSGSALATFNLYRTEANAVYNALPLAARAGIVLGRLAAAAL
jgi:hypothetical protein